MRVIRKRLVRASGKRRIFVRHLLAHADIQTLCSVGIGSRASLHDVV